MEDDEDFIALAQPRTTRYKPEIKLLRKPRSEDMRVVADAEIQALRNNVTVIELQRRVLLLP